MTLHVSIRLYTCLYDSTYFYRTLYTNIRLYITLHVSTQLYTQIYDSMTLHVSIRLYYYYVSYRSYTCRNVSQEDGQ